MEREVYLLLAGAVIAALVNVVMRLLEFFIRHIAKAMYFARSEKLEKKILRRKLSGLEEDKSHKRDFWLNLWEDLGKLKGGGGGGPWYTYMRPVDHLIFATQWLITIGAFLYWVFKVIPQLK
ncbi:MAG: hypothetical protein ABI904_05150 [Chloroflexota bacterium]